MFIAARTPRKIRYFCGLRLPEGIKLIYLSDRTTISFTSTPPYVKKYTSSEVGRSRLKCLVRLDKSLVEKKENCALLKTKTEDKYICMISAINKTGVVRSGPYSAHMQFGQKKQILSLTENNECQWTCTLSIVRWIKESGRIQKGREIYYTGKKETTLKALLILILDICDQHLAWKKFPKKINRTEVGRRHPKISPDLP